MKSKNGSFVWCNNEVLYGGLWPVTGSIRQAAAAQAPDTWLDIEMMLERLEYRVRPPSTSILREISFRAKDWFKI